jgi:hypothetical protein
MLPISSHLEGTQSIPFNELQYLQKDGYTSWALHLQIFKL